MQHTIQKRKSNRSEFSKTDYLIAEMQKRKAISEGEVFNFTQNYSNFNFEDEYKKKRLRSAVTEVYNGSGGYKHTRRSKTKRKTRRK